MSSKHHRHTGTSTNSGVIGTSQGFIPRLPMYGLKVDQASVYEDMPSVRIDQRRRRCSICGNVPRMLGLLEEDGTGGFRCRARHACDLRGPSL